MSLIRRFTVASATAALALTALVAPPSQAAETDVYTTPGGHIQSGRLWNTVCTEYSSTVVRCTTDIWATQIRYEDGQYRNVTGWHFNNLTYLPSARAAWKGNPLGETGTFTSAGRNWRTECDTAVSGRGGCRSYIETQYIATENGRYVTKTGYVFNNMVRFAEGSVQPVSEIPAHVLDQSVLTVDGLGPLGTRGDRSAATMEKLYNDYHKLDYVRPGETGDCYAWHDSPTLDDRGLSVVGLADVSVTKAGIRTDKGAEVGMTIGEVKALYGTAFQQVRKTNYGEQQYFGTVKVGERELQFRVLGEPYSDGSDRYAPTAPMKDSDVVVEISAQPYFTDVSFDGC